MQAKLKSALEKKSWCFMIVYYDFWEDVVKEVFLMFSSAFDECENKIYFSKKTCCSLRIRGGEESN